MYIGWDIGIKNLSYCILNTKGDIIEWDIIDLTGMDECKFKCNSIKKNGDICKKSASFINKSSTFIFCCKTHMKQIENEDKYVELYKCFKCNKDAKKRHIVKNEFFCLKHLDKNYKSEDYDTLIVKNVAKEKLNILGNILIDKLKQKPSILNVSHVVIENQPVLKNPTMKSIQMMLYSYYLIHFNLKKKELKLNLVSANTKLKFNINSETITLIKKNKNKYQKNKKLAIEYCKHFISNNIFWKNYFDNFDNKKDDLADSYLLIKYYLKKVVFKE